jgi:hypothetical protein
MGSYESMPSEPSERREVAVEVFGQHLFSLRNQRLEALRRAVDESEVRGRMGSLHRREYETVAELAPEAREAALGLARKAVDLYMQDFLGLLTDIGCSLDFGPEHAVNYKLVLQVKAIESESVVEEFVVNRDCRKVFYEYYGRWLNRYGGHK